MSAQSKNQNDAPMEQIQRVDITTMPVEALSIAVSKCVENGGVWTEEAKAYLANFLELYTKQLERKLKREILEEINNRK